MPQSALFPHWERDAFKEAFTLKFYDKAATEITGSQTFGAGIGFTSIVFDEASDNYRYYLDTGAHIEFDKNGTLVAPSGERGPNGDKGSEIFAAHASNQATPHSVTKAKSDWPMSITRRTKIKAFATPILQAKP